MKPARISSFVFLSLALLWALNSSAQSAEGRWDAEFRGSGRVDLDLDGTDHRSQSSFGVDAEDLQGFDPQHGDADPVRFIFAADAGRLVLDGKWDGRRRAAGTYRFEPSEEFERALAKMGAGPVDEDELFSALVHRMEIAWLEGLSERGLHRVRFDELLGMRIHDVSLEFIDAMAEVGLTDLSEDGLVSMRIHGVTPDFIEDLKELGFEHIAIDELIACRIHGVDRHFAQQALEDDERTTIDDLIEMRIHGSHRRHAKKH